MLFENSAEFMVFLSLFAIDNEREPRAQQTIVRFGDEQGHAQAFLGDQIENR